MRKCAAIVVCLILEATAGGQESFEVASIKPHPGIITHSADPSVTGNRVVAIASTLLDLIETAYRVRGDQISGAPGWAGSDHYDLNARAGASTITREQMRLMLQALLAERFHLRIHRETKEVPMYLLVVNKNGARLKESSPAEERKGQITGDGSGMHMQVSQGTMAQLAERLSSNGAGRPVADRTGLLGKYSFTLDWVNTVGPESEAPSLHVALEEQLGLRLESAKGASEVIVVEHVEKASAN
jgi:uncharacterized protein (TIGR03435 family)